MVFDEWRTTRQINEGRKPVAAANGILASVFAASDGSLMQRSSDGVIRRLLMYDGTVDGENEAVFLADGLVVKRSSDGTLHRWLTDAAIVTVDCGRDFYVALSAKGVVYTWGNGTAGQLGHGGGTDDPMPVRRLDGRRVVSVSARSTHCIALTDRGDAFAWGTIGELLHDPTPVRIALPTGVRVRSASAGMSHILLVTEDGALYSFGENKYGQLGHGGSVDRRTPTLVRALDRIRIASAAAGARHSLALTDGGSVLTWGGHNYKVGISTPAFVDGMLETVKVCYISTGENASFAVAVSGDTYTWWSVNDALYDGINVYDGYTMGSPTLVQRDSADNVIDKISVGTRETLFVTKSGIVFNWDTETRREHRLTDMDCSPADGRIPQARLVDPVSHKRVAQWERISVQLASNTPTSILASLVAMLSTNVDSECELAADALMTLSMNSTHHMAIVALGAIRPLVALLSAGGSDRLTRCVAVTLCRLADGNSEYSITIAREGAIEPLLALLDSDTLDTFYIANVLLRLSDVTNYDTYTDRIGAKIVQYLNNNPGWSVMHHGRDRPPDTGDLPPAIIEVD